MTGRSKAPRPLTEGEIKDYIAAYAKAASSAVHGAGFDGVEIHSGYGHLLDQFLQTVSNRRTDKWGGDEEGRTRFTREVVNAVVDAIGEDRVGIRISPWSTAQGEVLALCHAYRVFTKFYRAYFISGRYEDARPSTNLYVPRYRSARQAPEDGLFACD